jgi:hypothetical protein
MTKAHRSHPCSQTKNNAHRLRTYCIPWTKTTRPSYLTRSKSTITQLIMWKVHVTHDREHNYHDSLYSVEVAQLYSQVGDSITHRWLRVSILPNVHFLRCTARRSPHNCSQHFPARKTSTLRFQRCGLHHSTESPSCAKVRITPSIT